MHAQCVGSDEFLFLGRVRDHAINPFIRRIYRHPTAFLFDSRRFVPPPAPARRAPLPIIANIHIAQHLTRCGITPPVCDLRLSL